MSPLYPSALTTLGDHIRKVRLDRGLLQKDVAKIIKVDVMTITNWENNRSHPMVRYVPRIIVFLSYEPNLNDAPSEWGKFILEYRISNGITQKKMAQLIGIDDRTLSKFEKGEGWFFDRTKEKIQYFLQKKVFRKTEEKEIQN